MTKTPPGSVLTPEEHAAQANKFEAEARKADAEAALFAAQTREATATAREAEANARIAELATEKKERERAEEQAADVHNRVYRFDGQVTAQSASSCIKKLTEWHRLDPDCDIEVIFFSPGGSIIDGMAVFDHLRWLSSEGHKVTTGCTGYAASMAGILLQAGDYRWMSGESWLMIHQASFGASGTSFEVEDTVDWVNRIEKRIVKIFAARSTLSERQITRRFNRKNWWIDPDEALELGFVDEIRGSESSPE